MSKIAINTSQNVNINFNIASIGDRILAFFIDMIIKAAYMIVLFIILFKVILASCFMLLAISFSKKYFYEFKNLNLFIHIGIAFISYIFIVFLLKITEVKELFKSIFKVLKFF